jgi:hypothetical protein
MAFRFHTACRGLRRGRLRQHALPLTDGASFELFTEALSGQGTYRDALHEPCRRLMDFNKLGFDDVYRQATGAEFTIPTRTSRHLRRAYSQLNGMNREVGSFNETPASASTRDLATRTRVVGRGRAVPVWGRRKWRPFLGGAIGMTRLHHMLVSRSQAVHHACRARARAPKWWSARKPASNFRRCRISICG